MQISPKTPLLLLLHRVCACVRVIAIFAQFAQFAQHVLMLCFNSKSAQECLSSCAHPPGFIIALKVHMCDL